MKLHRTRTLLVACLGLAACVDNGDDSTGTTDGPRTGPPRACAALDTLDLGPGGRAVVDLDAAHLDPIVTDVFDRYAALLTPSGERVHVLAQAGVSDARIRRAREVLRLHLEDQPGTSAGADKADVADSVSASGGTLAIFADAAAYDLADAAVAAFHREFARAYVPLFGDRIVAEGTAAYLQPSPAWDQTFGATAVLVHRLGLVDTRPDLVQALRLARANAEADGTFAPAGPGAYADLDEAYLSVLLESHAGVWGHDPSGDGSARGGVYAFGSRDDMAAGDADTLALVEDFFARTHGFAAELDPSFVGTFDMLFRQNVGYTNRARYLTNVRLTGNNTAELFGNDLDNVLVGNVGNNNITGRGGDDLIDGAEGLDTAVFFAPQSEFVITDNGDGTYEVRHLVSPGFGTNQLVNIEILSFSDGVVQL